MDKSKSARLASTSSDRCFLPVHCNCRHHVRTACESMDRIALPQRPAPKKIHLHRNSSLPYRLDQCVFLRDIHGDTAHWLPDTRTIIQAKYMGLEKTGKMDLCMGSGLCSFSVDVNGNLQGHADCLVFLKRSANCAKGRWKAPDWRNRINRAKPPGRSTRSAAPRCRTRSGNTQTARSCDWRCSAATNARRSRH